MTTRASGAEDPRSFRTNRLTLAYLSPKPWPSTRSCQMAMAFRPFANSASMNSRNGSHALADGVEGGVRVSSAGPFSCSGSVDTSMAGFGWARPQPPGGRTGMPAAFKIGCGSFAPKVYGSFNPPQGPAKSAQRKDLLF